MSFFFQSRFINIFLLIAINITFEDLYSIYKVQAIGTHIFENSMMLSCLRIIKSISINDLFAFLFFCMI
jgi:hypothetical protein